MLEVFFFPDIFPPVIVAAWLSNDFVDPAVPFRIGGVSKWSTVAVAGWFLGDFFILQKTRGDHIPFYWTHIYWSTVCTCMIWTWNYIDMYIKNVYILILCTLQLVPFPTPIYRFLGFSIAKGNCWMPQKSSKNQQKWCFSAGKVAHCVSHSISSCWSETACK